MLESDNTNLIDSLHNLLYQLLVNNTEHISKEAILHVLSKYGITEEEIQEIRESCNDPSTKYCSERIRRKISELLSK